VRSVTASNQKIRLPSGTSCRRLQSGRPCQLFVRCHKIVIGLSTFLLILLTVCLVFVRTRWRQQVWYVSTKLHGATSQKTMFISTLWELYRKLLPSSVFYVAFSSRTRFYCRTLSSPTFRPVITGRDEGYKHKVVTLHATNVWGERRLSPTHSQPIR
jgi:hypothetical protein